MGERALTFIGWLFIVAVIIGTAFWIHQTKSISQPLPFNHKKHVDFGIACDACHVGAKDEVKASIPNVQTCALCHVPGKPNPKTPKELEEHITEMKTIPWKKIYEVPPHVRFSHKRHIQMAGLDCKSCHGNIENMEKAVSRQPVPLQMENCMSCHKKEKVSTDCLSCHR